MEQQIKALLSSPDEASQRLGCRMAKSVLKWSNWEIMEFVFNSPKGWEIRKNCLYGKTFLNAKIYFRLKCKSYSSLKFEKLDNYKLGTGRIGFCTFQFEKHKITRLKISAHYFIEQNL